MVLGVYSASARSALLERIRGPSWCNPSEFFGNCVNRNALAAVSGCGARPEALRYRIALEVETPAGLLTGCNVWESAATQGVP